MGCSHVPRSANVTGSCQVLCHVVAHFDGWHFLLPVYLQSLRVLVVGGEHGLNAPCQWGGDPEDLAAANPAVLGLDQVHQFVLQGQGLLPTNIRQWSIEYKRILKTTRIPSFVKVK